MVQKNAAGIYKKVLLAQAEQQRCDALSDKEAFIRLAKSRGYTFTIENLEAQLSQLSDEEVAAIFNPGIGIRRHLFPR